MSSYSHVCIRFVFIIFFLTAIYYELILADNDKLINSNSRHHIANSNERFATPVWINDNVLTSKEIKKFRNFANCLVFRFRYSFWALKSAFFRGEDESNPKKTEKGKKMEQKTDLPYD